MQIIKLLASSLLVFSLNINSSAESTTFQEKAVKEIFNSVKNHINTDSNTNNIPIVNNPRVEKFVERLFSAPSLYIKWLKALEISIQYDDGFSSVNAFLNHNKCISCTYEQVSQVFETKKSEHLVFWAGHYQTNLISNSGNGKKLDLVIDKHAKVKFNKVVNFHFRIDGKVIFGAKFKNYKLTWDYGVNIQSNDSKGSITFSEVFLNGKYIGHQFTGKLIRQMSTETFVGFTTSSINNTSNSLEESSNSISQYNNSGTTNNGNGNNANNGTSTNNSTSANNSAVVTTNILNNTTSEYGDTAKFSITLSSKPVSTLENHKGFTELSIVLWSDDPSEGRFIDDAGNLKDTISLTFTEENWSVPVTVTVYGQNDNLGDGDNPYQIKFQPITGGSNYAGLVINPINLINREDYDDIDPMTGKPRMTIGFIHYPAKKIGTQIWTTENMRHYPDKVGNGFWSSTDNSGDEFKFYNWNAAMNGETTEGAQGICAIGWHIPTDDDWKTLEGFLGMSKAIQDQDGTYRGTDQGAQLLTDGYSGFNAELLGYHANNFVQDQGLGTRFISSTSKNNNEFISRYIGERRFFARYILLQQSSSVLESWSFSEIEVMLNGINIALGAKAVFSGTGLYILTSSLWGIFTSNISEKVNASVSNHVKSALTGYDNDDQMVFDMYYPDRTGHSSLTDGSGRTGLSWGRTDKNLINLNGSRRLTVRPNEWLKIDLGKEYPIDSINIREFDIGATNPPFAVTRRFEANKIVIFTSQDDISSLTMTQLGLNNSVALRVGSVKDGANSSQNIQIPGPRSVFHYMPNASKAVWRGTGGKAEGNLVRCVKGANDKSISAHSPKRLTLKVGKPMTPIGFGDTVTSTTRNWSITPAVGNGLSFNTATGILSGTPLATQETTDYQVTTADDSKAVSSIAITITDGATMVSSIHIEGEHILKIGDNTQLNAIISPNYASNKKLAWLIIGDSDKASISQTGELIALKSGHIMIVATSLDNSATYATFSVLITAQEHIVFEGKNYLTTLSKKTRRVWLDRNLGASEACTSTAGTAACYGDLYQWGRGTDGHQIRNSTIVLSDIQATSITPDNGKFIINAGDWIVPEVDDSGKKRQLAWGNICPSGFNLPTLKELAAEMNDHPYLSSSLNLMPLNGLRNEKGQLQFVGIQGNYWTRDTGLPTITSVNPSEIEKHTDIPGIAGIENNTDVGSKLNIKLGFSSNIAGIGGSNAVKEGGSNTIEEGASSNAVKEGGSNTIEEGASSNAVKEGDSITIEGGISSNAVKGDGSNATEGGGSSSNIGTNTNDIVKPDMNANPNDIVKPDMDADPNDIAKPNMGADPNDIANLDKMNTSPVTLPTNLSTYLSFHSGNYEYLSNVRTMGMGVRCIKDLKDSPPFISPSVNNLNVVVGATIAPITFTNIGGMITKWRITPVLKSGLSFNTRTGTISGTPNKAMPAQRYRITASNASGADTAWVRITVQATPILTTGIQIQVRQATMKVNSSIYLDTIISPSNASDNSVSWSSSNTNLATVSKTGVVNTHAYGKVTILARSHDNPIVFDAITITIAEYTANNKSYNLISSPRTGRTWLDRNLGASRVCISSTDMACYGNLYQFGRANDGHQKRSNAYFESTQSDTVNAYNSAFIVTGKDWTSADQSGSLRKADWGYGSSNNICPAGFRVPTIDEFKDEKIDYDSVVFKNFLKLPMSGKRNAQDGILIEPGRHGYYWSNTTSSDHRTQNLNFTNNAVRTDNAYRNLGFSVRCIQDSKYKNTRYNQDPMEISGIRYKTIRIGTQIWTTENMRHNPKGSLLGYSYKNNPNYDIINGKYYTWPAAMRRSTKENAQGICASGWHIPTINDWKTLEAYLGMDKDSIDRQQAWRGNNQEGTQLKKWGSSGFNALTTGVMAERNNTFDSISQGEQISFWTSNRTSSHLASYRSLKASLPTIYQGTINSNKFALNVRCIKNPPAPMIIQNFHYKVVKIGNQVWTAENMRHNASHGRTFSNGNTDDYGKLYDWEAAMDGSKAEGAQGICALGWHIPTDNDWKTLEGHLYMDKKQRNTRWAWRGSNQGYHLKKTGYSGFNARMAGRVLDHNYTLKGKEGYFWTSSRNKLTPLFRSLKDSLNRVYRGADNTGTYGLSVRCIKDAN
ncbi:FISUMP domain-containing protein [Bathymodiolus thermophilus thioautotrophic gill symbiont]|uniref:BIG2 domain-containing protein n=1 Tax=Bathymodiolus thermophilus thioautotrophic gill symbiont TaxID=2360 RepID=A0A1J5TZQ2_9GAMM|nr:FISUMP domain-containing protein [Bathymodiolus thermophilus thioautotrophic gill symbiont]OIR25716.1 hypothetical protein BGC33_13850 [Bathymodiolus thermophilus thioautotrophic gill symbiont]